MVKNHLSYKSIGIFCMATMALFSSCKKDELESKELLVYVDGEYSSMTNTITVPFIHSPVAVSGNTMVLVAAEATREVPADIDVTITPDPSLITQYNQKNKTACLPLPESAYKIINPGKFRIVAGKIASDSMKIEIIAASTLTDPNGYLLPLSISGIEGKDKGAKVSTNKRTVYLNVTYTFNNIQPSESPVSGTLMARTTWVSTVSNTTSGALGPAMLDGSNTTAWRSSNSSTAEKWVSIDMGSVQTIKGLQLTPNYVTVTENATGINVSTSTDNITWKAQGAWKGTGPITGSTAAAPDLKGIGFIAPVQARYFRLDITSWVSSNRVGIAELNAVQ